MNTLVFIGFEFNIEQIIKYKMKYLWGIEVLYFSTDMEWFYYVHECILVWIYLVYIIKIILKIKRKFR